MEPSDVPPTRTSIVPIGALGDELARVQATPTTIVLTVAAIAVVVGGVFGLPAVATRLSASVGAVPAIWIAAALAIAGFTLAVAVVALAREVRRTLGSAHAAVDIPTTPEAADTWLAATPDTDDLRTIRLEALVLARRFDEARRLSERLPDTTPLDGYRRIEAQALVDDQTGQPIDEAALRAAVTAVPAGLERAEAAASLAVLLARRALPAGRWQEPLLAVRPLIPGSDGAILVRDLGLPIFRTLVPRVVLPAAVLIGLIGAGVTVTSLPG